MSVLKDVSTGGGNTIAIETGGNLDTIATAITGTLTVSGPLTDAQLRASAVPVSAASLPLATGAATEGKQDAGNTSLSSIDGKLPALSSSRVPVYATGGAAANAAATGNPVLVAGWDGGNTVRVPLVDSGGKSYVVPHGMVASGAAVGGAANPTLIAGQDGTNVQTLRTTTTGAVQVYPARTSLTASSPATASITTASATVIAANANRTGLVVTNTHATSWLYLGIGATAVVGSGIALAPNGGCLTMDAHTFSTAAVNGIASAGTITVAVQEFA